MVLYPNSCKARIGLLEPINETIGELFPEED
jgi:hypothetical protein